MNKVLLKKATPARSSQSGVVLIEAMVAILLFSLGVLALAGLQASLIRSSTDSRSRAEAVYLAQQKIGEMWADPAGAAAGNYITATGPVPVPGLPNGKMSVTQPNKVGEYEIQVTWMAPGETTEHNIVMVANVVQNK